MTLLYCPPCFLDHETGNHPERADRIRRLPERLAAAGLLGQCRTPEFQPAARQWLARVHSPGLYRRGLGLRQVGRGIHRVRHGRQPRQLRRGADGRRQRLRRGRADRPRRRHPGPVPGPSARPPRHDQPRDGLLPVQQHRGGRPAGHRLARAGTGVDRRLGHPSRQRHAGRVLGRPASRLPLDPPLGRSIPARATPTRRAAAAAWARR